MLSWGLVTGAHALISNKAGFITGSYKPISAVISTH